MIKSSRRKQQNPLKVNELACTTSLPMLEHPNKHVVSVVNHIFSTVSMGTFDVIPDERAHLGDFNGNVQKAADYPDAYDELESTELESATELDLNKSMAFMEAEDFVDGVPGYEPPSKKTTSSGLINCSGTQQQHRSPKKDANARRGAMKIPPVMLETGEEVYYCPICEEQGVSILARTPSDLTEHLRSHNKPPINGEGHKCALCGETLSSQSSLDRHMLTHSNERPYVCCVCNADFTTNGNTRRHLEVHERTESNPEILGLIREQLRGDRRRKRKREEQLLNSSDIVLPQCESPPEMQSNFQEPKHEPVVTASIAPLLTPLPISSSYGSFNSQRLAFSNSMMMYNPMLMAATMNNANLLPLIHMGSSTPSKSELTDSALTQLFNKEAPQSAISPDAESPPKICSQENLMSEKCDGTGTDTCTDKFVQRESRMCSLCDSIFEKVSDLTVHINKVHCGRQPYQCRACDAETFDKSTIRRHVLIHIDGPAGNPYVCTLCEERREGRLEELPVHLRKSKKSRKAELSVELNSTLESINSTFSGDDAIRGQWRFTTKANARRHFDSKHNSDPALGSRLGANAWIRFEPPPEPTVKSLINSPDAMCNGCGQDLKFFRELHRHLNSNPICQQATQHFTCHTCAQNFRSCEPFIAHVRLHHPDLKLSLSRDGLVRVGVDRPLQQQLSTSTQFPNMEALSAGDDEDEDETHMVLAPQHTSSPMELLPLDLSKPKGCKSLPSEGDSGALDLSPKHSHSGSSPDNLEHESPFTLMPLEQRQPFTMSVANSSLPPLSSLPHFANNFGMGFGFGINPTQLMAASLMNTNGLVPPSIHAPFNPQYPFQPDVNSFKMLFAGQNWQPVGILPNVHALQDSETAATPAATEEIKERLRQKINEKRISGCEISGTGEVNNSIGQYAQRRPQKKTRLQKPCLNSALLQQLGLGLSARFEEGHPVNEKSNQQDLIMDIGATPCSSEEEISHTADDDVSSCYTSSNASDLLRNIPKKKNSYKDAPNKIACPEAGCTHYFPWMSSLKRHIITHTDKKPFHCTRCQHAFSTKSNRERHMERIHGVKKNGEDLSEHEKNQLDMHDHVAEAMGTELLQKYGTLYTTTNLERSTSRSRNVSSLSNGFLNQSNLFPKSTVCTATMPLSLTIPGAQIPIPAFNVNTAADGLLELETDKVNDFCPCDVRHDNRKALQRHIRCHLQDAIFKCHICVEIRPNRREMLEHLQLEHNPEWSMLCEKLLLNSVDDFLAAAAVNKSTTPSSLCSNSPSPLYIHLSGAEESTEDSRVDKKINCAVCLRRFWSHQDLQRHMRSHSGARPYCCDICGRKFTLKHSLQRHQKTHSTSQATGLQLLTTMTADSSSSNPTPLTIWQPFLAKKEELPSPHEDAQNSFSSNDDNHLSPKSSVGKIAFPFMKNADEDDDDDDEDVQLEVDLELDVDNYYNT